MLGKRFLCDGKPCAALNPTQAAAKEEIIRKINGGAYKMEEVPCAVCSGSSFERLSEKERFGFCLPIVICRDCGLIQMSPRLTESSYAEYYRREFRRLGLGKEEPSWEYSLDEYFHGQQICYFLRDFLKKSPKELLVLEIGCGAAGIVAYFRDAGCQVVGLDVDEEHVQYGRKTYNLDLRAGNLSQCRLEKKPDVVIMSHVLEHLSNPNHDLELLRSLINPEGLVYIEVPGVRNLTFIHNDMDFLRNIQISHTYYFSLVTLINLLNKNGFEFVRGQEKIRSVFKPGVKKSVFVNDYQRQMRYLFWLEKGRRILPIRPFQFRRSVESAYCGWLKKAGLYEKVRGIYRWFIGRKEPVNFIKR
ncbi:MAG: class I SAM-dependent methyltransferase [Candidatus Omnitrophota bacterium]